MKNPSRTSGRDLVSAPNPFTHAAVGRRSFLRYTGAAAVVGGLLLTGCKDDDDDDDTNPTTPPATTPTLFTLAKTDTGVLNYAYAL